MEESFLLLQSKTSYILEHSDAYLKSPKDNLEIKILCQMLNSAYSKLKFNQKCPYIFNAEDNNINNNQLFTKIKNIISGQSEFFIYTDIINGNLLYLKSLLLEKCCIINIDDILNNIFSYIKLDLESNSADNTNQNSNEESIKNNIKGINDAFNKIINLINIFNAFRSKILLSLQNKYQEIAKLEDRIQDQKNDESQDKKDDESQDKKEDESQDKKEDESQDKKEDESQDKKEDESQDKKDDEDLDKKDGNKFDIQCHFEQKVSSLSNEISKMMSKIDQIKKKNQDSESQPESKTNHQQVSFDGNSFFFSRHKSILDEFASLFTNEQQFIFNLALLRSYSEIQSFLIDEKIITSSCPAICSIEHLFDAIQRNWKKYYLDYIVKIILKHLFSQDLIIHHCNTKFENFGITFNKYTLKCDNDLKFFLEKKHEKQIIMESNSKFIVHTKTKAGTQIEIDLIPYFPCGSLISLVNSKPEERINFTFVDKVVIILEIATALKDLHWHCRYHGNLCSDFIFINSSKDAYLSCFCCDQNNDDFEFKKLNDIYSFGALMIVILTEKIISFNEFISSCNFRMNDDQGNCMVGMKEIINRCMMEKREERYQSFNELIDAIHSLSIYEKNKEEIEFRISKADDAASYECSISDLLESCWHGQSNEIIELFLDKYHEICSCKKTKRKHLENIVSKTISFIDFDINSFLFNLSNLKNPVDSSLFLCVIKSFYKYYYKYVLKSEKNDLIMNFLSTIVDNPNSNSKDKVVYNPNSSFEDKVVDNSNSNSKDKVVDNSNPNSKDKVVDNSNSNSKDKVVDNSNSNSKDKVVDNSNSNSKDKVVDNSNSNSKDKVVDNSNSNSKDKVVDNSNSNSKDKVVDNSNSNSKDKVVDNSNPNSKDKVVDNSNPNSKDKVVDNSNPNSKDKVVDYSNPNSKDKVVDYSNPNSKDKVVDNSNPNSKDKVVDNSNSNSKDKVVDNSNPNSKDKVVDYSNSNSKDKVVDNSNSNSKDKVVDNSNPNSKDKVVDNSNPNSKDKVVDNSNPNSKDKVVDYSNPNSKDKVVDYSNPNSKDKVVDYSNPNSKDKVVDNSNSNSKDKVVDYSNSSFIAKINKIQQDKKYYLFDYLAHLILTSILDQEKFSIGQEYQKVLKQTENSNNDDFVSNKESKCFIDICQELNFGRICASYELVIDNNMKLYLRKTFNGNVNEKSIKHEQEILNQNLSPFIVRPLKTNANEIILPYFPIGSLESIFIETQSSQRTIEFTLVDKFVIILEIATALNDLHEKEQYHGNLCSDFIFINSSKDAYLGGFCYDRETENESTKIPHPIMYRAPETDNEQMELSDVYSFGVLMHEILTNKSLPCRFKNNTRDQFLEIKNGDYFKFLFSKSDGNEFFDEKNGIEEMKEIIEKCMKIDKKDRFQSFNELIQKVREVNFYNRNKDEIEFRLSKAVKSEDYQCNISDLFESYYRGQESSKDDIENIIKKYNEITSKDDKNLELYNENLVEKMFVAFDIKPNQVGPDYSEYFKDIFDIIIEKCIRLKEKANNMIIDMDNPLLSLSIELNRNAGPTIPICSLQSFIDNIQKEKYGEYLLMWLYLIAKELSILHSYNLFYGDLSFNKICLYYNSSLKMLVPSIILSYSYCKSRSYNRECNCNDKIDKLQMKDIKKFKEIVKHYLKEGIFDVIKDVETMNEIIYFLYNFIKNNNAGKNIIKNCGFSFDDYSSFKMTYSSMKDTFKLILDNYSFKGLTINFVSIYNVIFNYLEKAQENMNRQILCNFPVIECSDQKPNDIQSLIDGININCISLYKSISNTESENNDIDIATTDNYITISKKKKEKTEDSFTKLYSFELINYSNQKITFTKTKMIPKLHEKIVDLYFDCNNETGQRSFKFLIQRILLRLNPYMHYRINIDVTKHASERICLMDDKKIRNFIQKCSKIANIKLTEIGEVDIIKINRRSSEELSETNITRFTFEVLPNENWDTTSSSKKKHKNS